MIKEEGKAATSDEVEDDLPLQTGNKEQTLSDKNSIYYQEPEDKYNERIR